MPVNNHEQSKPDHLTNHPRKLKLWSRKQRGRPRGRQVGLEENDIGVFDGFCQHSNDFLIYTFSSRFKWLHSQLHEAQPG